MTPVDPRDVDRMLADLRDSLKAPAFVGLWLNGHRLSQLEGLLAPSLPALLEDLAAMTHEVQVPVAGGRGAVRRRDAAGVAVQGRPGRADRGAGHARRSEARQRDHPAEGHGGRGVKARGCQGS